MVQEPLLPLVEAQPKTDGATRTGAPSGSDPLSHEGRCRVAFPSGRRRRLVAELRHAPSLALR